MEPGSATCPAALRSINRVYNPIARLIEDKLVTEPFTYPLNLAIEHKACTDVIGTLIETTPSVLTKRDGVEEELPLAILLQNTCDDLVTVQKIVASAPECIAATDRYQNTALHVVCASGSSLPVVRLLCAARTESLLVTNFYGLTPLELSQRRISFSSEAVSAYLLAKTASLTG